MGNTRHIDIDARRSGRCRLLNTARMGGKLSNGQHSVTESGLIEAMKNYAGMKM